MLSHLSMRTEQIDHKYLGRDSDSDKIEVERITGSSLFTTDGKTHIDFVMGWCVGNFGWDNPEIKNRLKNFKGPDYVSPHHLYKPWTELAQKLHALAPGKLKKSFRATGGTEAVEIALSAAMSFTERTKFISVDGAYHGDSIVARSIGSPSYGDWYRNPFSAHRMRTPLDSRSAEHVELWLKNKDIAAIIMEPVICNKGVTIPTPEFMNHIQTACKKYGTLLIMDEVATGFLRTGKMFACEHYNVQPDIMCLGKAISGGFAPMGATLMTDEVAEAMHYDSSYYSTYGWHPLSVEAALGTLDYLQKNFAFLQMNIREMSHYIVEQLSLMEFKYEPTIRNKGMAFGVSFKDREGNYGSKIVEKARANGLLLSEAERGFTMFPALNIDRSTVDEALSILLKSI